MEGLIKDMLSAYWLEALKIWGPYALVLTPLGFGNWSKSRRLAQKDREIAALQEKRVEDATRLVRVTEAATTVIAARAHGDEQLTRLLAELVDQISGVKAQVSVIRKRLPGAPKRAGVTP